MPHIIDFQPVGRRGPCPGGGSLLDAARDLGVDLAGVCGGQGTCGRCRVQIVAGQATPVTASEAGELSSGELSRGYRLACQATPLSDCRVLVPPESLTAPQRTQVEGLEVKCEIRPSVTSCLVSVDPPAFDGPSGDDLRGDDQRLCQAVSAATGVRAALPDLEVARAAGPGLRRLGWQALVTLRGRELIDVAAPGAPRLGLALDMGTTKLAAYLVDLAGGETISARGAMNPQVAYGEDVISRVAYAGGGADQSARLQALLAAGLSRLAAEVCEAVGARPTDIVDAVAVGNTAMHHLFLRLPVRQLGEAPYVPAVCDAVDVKARDTGLALAPGAWLHLLPNIAGFVGADHVAMLLATGIGGRAAARPRGRGHRTLAIDIGTNTEMCLASGGRLTSLSCASGPAFEGAHIKFGMRAAPGAIERVRIAGGRVEYKTIGDAPPVGICGSGLLDAVAHLRRAGSVSASGRLAGPGVRDGEGGTEYVISGAEQSGNGHAITVTQKDIRELQLAKGAIRCGIETLLRDAGLAAGELDRVIIAGAFGTYIDVQSAIGIGLLPNLPPERVSQVGNAAGAGARLALISRAERRKARELAARVRYLELARSPTFMEDFTEAMSLTGA